MTEVGNSHAPPFTPEYVALSLNTASELNAL